MTDSPASHCGEQRWAGWAAPPTRGTLAGPQPERRRELRGGPQVTEQQFPFS